MPINKAVLDKFPTLTEWTSGPMGLTDEDMEALVKVAKTNPHLKTLRLTDNSITHVGAKLLATLVQLEVLSLDNNDIGDEGLKAIAGMPNLKVLVVGGNNISDASVKALVDSNIVELYIYGNNITDKGGREFLKNKKLIALDVSVNEIEDDSLLATIATHIDTNKKASLDAQSQKDTAIQTDTPFWKAAADAPSDTKSDIKNSKADATTKSVNDTTNKEPQTATAVASVPVLSSTPKLTTGS